MRCECCDAELSDAEATAKFAESDGSKPYRYVGMCKECRGFLPKNVVIITRPDLENRKETDDAYLYDPFDLGTGEGGEWDDS